MDKQSSYWVNFIVKNGKNTIKKALESILSQSIKPEIICIVDDGSSDGTDKILLEIKKEYKDIIHIITLPDNGYDIRRIVHNWNKSCDFIKKLNVNFNFMLIATEDVIFPSDYVEKLIKKMINDKDLVVMSGSRGLEQSDYSSLPEGAGRLVKMSFFKEIGFHFPPYYGYEPWILYKALQLGYQVRKENNLKYEHSRIFGSKHNFIEYGPSMRCLGYHPMFVLVRVLRNIFMNKTGISKKASITMLIDYFNNKKWKDDPYFHYFEPNLRQFVWDFQKIRMLSKFKRLF
jgi:glycosyltransferase involved in cell wall biosynthesis